MIDNSNPYEKPVLRAIAIVAAIALVIVGGLSSYPGLSFQPESGDAAMSVLGRLVLISFFIERGIEVFVELWRGSVKNKKKHDIKVLQEEQGRAKDKPQDEEALQERLWELQEDLHCYKAVTIRISLWTGFLFGLLISIAGVRALEALMSVPAGEAQAAFFQGLDILLTAALISGGSEGIHRFMTVYKRFMEGSEQRLKERSSQP